MKSKQGGVRHAGLRLGHEHGLLHSTDSAGIRVRFATSVNSRGDVVGRLIDTAGRQNAWALDKHGTYQVFQVPDATLTNARGINNKGEVVGVYRCDVNHGFVLPPHDSQI